MSVPSRLRSVRDRKECATSHIVLGIVFAVQFWSSTRLAAALRSASTISFTRQSKVMRRFQPRTRSAFAGLPNNKLMTMISEININEVVSWTHSTSAGRKYLGSTLTTAFPVFTSMACSSSPLPSHLVLYQRIQKVLVERSNKQG